MFDSNNLCDEVCAGNDVDSADTGGAETASPARVSALPSSISDQPNQATSPTELGQQTESSAPDSYDPTGADPTEDLPPPAPGSPMAEGAASQIVQPTAPDDSRPRTRL
ncbi:hypothetical protein PVAP13_1KG278900 [Panicum virgatum]|uniref:Uncharacterized protein n=1 Tax=Panicum virgatum TaxID=38727 RepID=A0A8T0XIS8_PANVG|nr:hypothetical protein PVAP13_1KG278900 [Panicum virgatum]